MLPRLGIHSASHPSNCAARLTIRPMTMSWVGLEAEAGARGTFSASRQAPSGDQGLASVLSTG